LPERVISLQPSTNFAQSGVKWKSLLSSACTKFVLTNWRHAEPQAGWLIEISGKSVDKIEFAARRRCTLVFFSWPMQILFVISILCFLVLLWAALAIIQHVRTGHRRTQPAAQLLPDFSPYFSAANFQTTANSPRRD
jgi:hypothetical protein